MRFYLFRLKDASGVLTVQSRMLRSGANDNVLWLSEISQSYSWQRAEATFSSSDNSKVREDQDFCIYHKVNCACSARVHLATSLCRQQQQQRVRSFLWPTTYARTPPEKIWIQIQSLYRTKVLRVREKDVLQHQVFIVSKQIVFRYESGHEDGGLVALDDISFSRECVFDPENSNLPDTSPTSSPTTTGSAHPCQVDQKRRKQKS